MRNLGGDYNASGRRASDNYITWRIDHPDGQYWSFGATRFASIEAMFCRWRWVVRAWRCTCDGANHH